MCAEYKKYDSATLALKTEHWLQVKIRINFKVIVIMFASQRGKPPAYIHEKMEYKTDIRPLRSNNGNLLKIKQTE